jgi:hypothetical protein
MTQIGRVITRRMTDERQASSRNHRAVTPRLIAAN